MIRSVCWLVKLNDLKGASKLMIEMPMNFLKMGILLDRYAWKSKQGHIKKIGTSPSRLFFFKGLGFFSSFNIQGALILIVGLTSRG